MSFQRRCQEVIKNDLHLLKVTSLVAKRDFVVSKNVYFSAVTLLLFEGVPPIQFPFLASQIVNKKIILFKAKTSHYFRLKTSPINLREGRETKSVLQIDV